jgi:hypothetical protein
VVLSTILQQNVAYKLLTGQKAKTGIKYDNKEGKIREQLRPLRLGIGCTLLVNCFADKISDIHLTRANNKKLKTI